MFVLKNKAVLVTGIGISVGCGIAMPGYTQPTAAHGVLEEITVSARRTEESIQSTPVTITAFSTQTLREKTISTPEDLQLSTPGVFLSGTGSRQNVIYTIRGQAKSLLGPNSPAVVSYFAEVPDPDMGSFVPQYDLESVQVLKGPQGTLFGRNTTGGAVLYSPVMASYETNGYLSGTVGSYGKREIQGAVTVPLIEDKLAVRLAGDIDRRDPFTKNLSNDSDIDNVDNRSWRVSVLWEPTASLTNKTVYDHYRSDSGGTAQIIGEIYPDSPLLGQLGLRDSALQALAQQKAWGPFKSNAPMDIDEKNERIGVTNRTEFQLTDNIELVNIFGYRKTELHIVSNTDGMGTLAADGTGALPLGTPVDFIKANLTYGAEQLSNEIQLRGKLDDGKLDWLVGAFWLNTEPNGSQGNAVAFAQIPGTPLSPPNYNFTEQTSKALFGHLTYDLGAFVTGLQAELGIRYTKDETESCTALGVNTQVGPVTAPSDVVSHGDCKSGAANVVNASSNKVNSDEYTWSVGLNWQLTDELFSYVVSRHGYRAGGVNGPTLAGRMAPFQTFEPETVTDIEWGIRADWTLGEMSVRTNLSAFLGRYGDVQQALIGVQSAPGCDPAVINPPGISPDGDCDITNDPAGGTLLVNAGKAEVSGIDFDAAIAVTPDLTLSIGGNYLDMKTRRYDLPAAFDPYVATKQIAFNLAAQKTFIAGVRYELPSVPFADNVVFNVDYYWTDEFMYSDATLPAYEVANMRVDINGVMNSGLDLSVFGRNIFDKEYAASGSAASIFTGVSSYVYGAPRIYGAELRYRF